ncbi:MAG: preprotein translocase subunit SecG [Muribaculaceae bacterium]
MYTILTILILISAILLVGVVLIQKSKGGGLASNFSGSNQIMGVRKTTDFVEKATWTLALVICVLSILSAFVAPRDLVQGSKIKKAVPQTEQTTTAFPTEKAATTTPATKAPAPAATPAKPAN